MRKIRILPTKRLKGEIIPPGDKSISHRALIFASLAEGNSLLKGLCRGKDVLSTWTILNSLGVKIKEEEEGVVVEGRGGRDFKEPENVLDAGNSGTTLRLLAGVLSGQNFLSILTGDVSLRQRPMKRIVEPLSQMGALIMGRKNNLFPPLVIKGGELSSISWSSPIPSAQVKSAILLAGFFASGWTEVREPLKSRDHTERMFRFMGGEIEEENLKIRIKGGGKLKGKKLKIPGDFSSAIFFLFLSLLHPRAEIKIKGVGINPTRTGILPVITQMGGKVEIKATKKEGEEPVGDLKARFSCLEGVEVKGETIPSLIDEIPILSVACSLARGESEIRGAEELRVKETDRIKAMVINLRKMGVKIRELKDGMVIKGPAKLKGAEVESFGDHRVAMSMVIGGLLAEGETVVKDTECVKTSFPEFIPFLKGLGANLEEK